MLSTFEESMGRTLFLIGKEIEPRFLMHFHESMQEALRQLRFAVGTGAIFYGFDLRAERDSDSLLISPGLAFDGMGRAVTLENILHLPLPPKNEERPLWLCLRHHTLVEERDIAGRALRERDSVEVLWLLDRPHDDETILLACLRPTPSRWDIDSSVARRAPPLAHSHTGHVSQDRSDRLRFDGVPIPSPGTAEAPDRLARLEAAASAEFAKLQGLMRELEERLQRQNVELETLQAQVAEGTEDSEHALLRAELDTLRLEVVSLAQRPTSARGSVGTWTPVTALRGVGERFADKLREVGIETVRDFLAAGGNSEARERVESLGIPRPHLERWGREADLLRLHGVGPKEAVLLEIAGIGSTAELAVQEPSALYERLRVAAAKQENGTPPALAWVESWIEQACRLPPVLGW